VIIWKSVVLFKKYFIDKLGGNKGDKKMGVKRSDYIVIGVNLNDYVRMTEELNNKLSKFDDVNGDLFFISDDMNEKYNILGYIMKGDKEGYDGLGYNEINLRTFDDISYEVKKDISEILGMPVEVKLIVVTNWH
jgi:hypothetical protein